MSEKEGMLDSIKRHLSSQVRQGLVSFTKAKHPGKIIAHASH